MGNRRPKVGLVYDEMYLAHNPGQGHPESPCRLKTIISSLQATGLTDKLRKIKPARTKKQWLTAVHDSQYIEIARQDSLQQKKMLSTGDTAISEGSFRAATRAVGGVVAAVDAVVEGKADSVFCAVRPPGHHATPSAGAGFCIFNNTAIAAKYAQTEKSVGKIMIVDWDVHHGNGTQDIFYEDNSVLVCSIHQDGLFPMPITGKGHACETGCGKGLGMNINIPLPAGSGDEDVISVLTSKVASAAHKFSPELIIMSAGFDIRHGDLLGDFQVSDDGFARLTRVIMQMMDRPKIISVLEGGYDCAGLAKSVPSHVASLLGD